MKKKKSAVFICFCIFCILTFTTVISAETVGGTSETLTSRIFEYAVRYKSEILSLSGDGLILAGVFILKSVFKKKTSDISADLKVTKVDASSTKSGQASVIEAVNEMVTAYNEMRLTYEKNQRAEEDRCRLVGAVMAQNTAILDILQCVYVNSKNLPQGVKDIVTLKYADVLKALENDDKLLGLVEQLRSGVCDGEVDEQ